jgi:hypothetical protein
MKQPYLFNRIERNYIPTMGILGMRMKSHPYLALNDRSYSRRDNRRIARLCHYCRNAEDGRSGKSDWEVILLAFLSQF